MKAKALVKNNRGLALRLKHFFQSRDIAVYVDGNRVFDLVQVKQRFVAVFSCDVDFVEVTWSWKVTNLEGEILESGVFQ